MMTRTMTRRTRDRLLVLLKTRGPQSTPTLARKLELTSMAVRLHLQELEQQGLVQSGTQPQGVGRPRKVWSLTAEADPLFPEGYADLAVDLLQEARRQFGQRGVDALLTARLAKQTKAYRRHMPPAKAALSRRVRTLARLRSEEGYMAEVVRHRDDDFTLIENHCPVCAAATICVGLCNMEQQMFEQLLGSGVTVQRSEHVLEGERRCTYRITRRSAAARRRKPASSAERQ
jgi:predicted ArsR family transcriptional regulator